MEFGVGYFPTHDGMRPGEIARRVEERGQTALYFAEHTHIPASRETPWGGGRDLPRKYWNTYDLFVALTAAAEATSRLRIGSGVCLVVERDPITTAKEVASVDHLSGGRFLFGVGAGWNREEMANHVTDPRTRMALMTERLAAMRQIWTTDEAEYHGRFVDFDPIWSYPKPLQSPLPVLVGGMGPTVEDRILSVGDGWLAESVPLEELDEFADRVAKLQQRAAEAGRRRIPVTMFDAPTEAGMAERYQAAGVDRFLFQLPNGDTSEVARDIDRLADRIR